MMCTVYASQKWSRVIARLQMVVRLRYIRTREFVNNKTLHAQVYFGKKPVLNGAVNEARKKRPKPVWFPADTKAIK